MCECWKRWRGRDESAGIFCATSSGNSAGDAGTRVAGGHRDAAGRGGGRAAGSIGGAAAVASETDSGRGEYCGNDSEPGAFWIFAAGAVAGRSRGPAGDRSAGFVCAAADYSEYGGGNYGRRRGDSRRGARHGHDRAADSAAGGIAAIVFNDAGRNSRGYGTDGGHRDDCGGGGSGRTGRIYFSRSGDGEQSIDIGGGDSGGAAGFDCGFSVGRVRTPLAARALMMRGAAWRLGIFAGVVFAWVIVLGSCGAARHDEIVVGSKNFSEQALLGEIVAQHLEARTHREVTRRFYLAGSYICQQALLAGRIDLYVEYTGTALTAILHDPLESDPAALLQRVRSEYQQRFGLAVLPSLGFNNTFAIVVRGEDARRLHLKTISDAAPYAHDWRAGFGYEFMERPDGFAGLARTYGLAFRETPRILDLGLLYRALLEKQVDLVAGNSTDGLIAARDLVILGDDKHYFPPYEAVPIVREDTLARYPEVEAAIAGLAGKISDAQMQKMNYAVAGQGRDVSDVAREFLHSTGLD